MHKTHVTMVIYATPTKAFHCIPSWHSIKIWGIRADEIEDDERITVRPRPLTQTDIETLRVRDEVSGRRRDVRASVCIVVENWDTAFRVCIIGTDRRPKISHHYPLTMIEEGPVPSHCNQGLPRVGGVDAPQEEDSPE
jgi:hypothetical protein